MLVTFNFLYIKYTALIFYTKMDENDTKEETTDSDNSLMFTVIKIKNNEWILDCFKRTRITINVKDIQNQKNQWNNLFRFISCYDDIHSIYDIQSEYKFIVLDRYFDKQVKKYMKSVGMIMNLNNMKEFGVTPNDLRDLLLDREKRDNILRKFDHLKVKPLLQWIQIVDVSDIVQLAQENGDINGDILVIWHYYCC